MNKTNVSLREQPKVRQSGVELLKVIAILLICLSHCTQTLENFTDFQVPTTDIQLLILRFLRFDGQIGNIIFVICSSWFLLESKAAKKNKAINLALDSQVISIGILAVFVTLSLIFDFHVNYTPGLFIHNIFPDLFEQVWFVPTYLIFYLVHPYLNKIINGLNQREHFGICIFITFVYGFGSLINAKTAYSNLLGFFMIYVIVAYFKLYGERYRSPLKTPLIGFAVSVVLFVAVVLIKNVLAFKNNYFNTYPSINNLLSVFLFPMILCLFFVFLNFDFHSKFINYLSSCSLFVYCIHENALVRESLRPKFYEIVIEHFGDGKLLLYDLILWVLIAFSSFLAAAIYKTVIHKLTFKLSNIIEAKITKQIDKIFLTIKNK